jgi:hypothetical protein
VDKFEEHPSRASSWRDGRLVVLPEAETADSTVWFATQADAGGEALWEGLLARRTGDDRARVCAVSFWLYDVNLGDEVSLVESAEGASVATGTLTDAGCFTFRFVFEDAGAGDHRWHELMVELERYECWFDVRSPAFVALSAPCGHAQSVADILAAKERGGELRYETGRSQPPGGRRLR